MFFDRKHRFSLWFLWFFSKTLMFLRFSVFFYRKHRFSLGFLGCFVDLSSRSSRDRGPIWVDWPMVPRSGSDSLLDRPPWVPTCPPKAPKVLPRGAQRAPRGVRGPPKCSQGEPGSFSGSGGSGGSAGCGGRPVGSDPPFHTRRGPG